MIDWISPESIRLESFSSISIILLEILHSISYPTAS